PHPPRSPNGDIEFIVCARDAAGHCGYEPVGIARHLPAAAVVVDTIALEDAFALAIRATDAAGSVAGAHVAVVHRFRTLTVATTGADGIARFGSIPAGLFDIAASAPGRGRGGVA